MFVNTLKFRTILHKNCHLFGKTVRNYATPSISQVVDKNLDYESAKPYSAIPGPKKLPIIGNNFRFLPVIGEFYGLPIHEMLRKMRNQYGNIIKLSGLVGRKDMIFILSPDAAETVLRNEGTYPQRDVNDAFVYYRSKIRNDVYQGYGGIFTEQGEKWHQVRTILNPVLLKPQNLECYYEGLNDVTDDLIHIIREFSKKSPINEMPENFVNELSKWSFEMAALIALDTRLGVLKQENQVNKDLLDLVNLPTELFDLMYKLEILPSLWKYYKTKNFKRLVEILDIMTFTNLKYINKALERSQNLDEGNMSILQKILKLTNKPLAVSVAMDIMLAGIDTSSKSLGAILYYLAKNPDKQQILRDELIQNLPKKNSPITKEVLNNSPYLKAVVKESLRIAPVAAGFARTATKDFVLEGYQIPKDVVLANLSLLNLHDDKYYKKANQFMPERFLRSTTDEYSSKNVHPFIYIPFGFGPRSCIGQRIALLGIYIGLAKVIRNFELEWHHPDMKFVSNILYTIGDPLKLQVNEVKN